MYIGWFFARLLFRHAETELIEVCDESSDSWHAVLHARGLRLGNKSHNNLRDELCGVSQKREDS